MFIKRLITLSLMINMIFSLRVLEGTIMEKLDNESNDPSEQEIKVVKTKERIEVENLLTSMKEKNQKIEDKDLNNIKSFYNKLIDNINSLKPEEKEDQNPEKKENQNPEKKENQNPEKKENQNPEEKDNQKPEEKKNQNPEEKKNQNPEILNLEIKTPTNTRNLNNDPKLDVTKKNKKDNSKEQDPEEQNPENTEEQNPENTEEQKPENTEESKEVKNIREDLVLVKKIENILTEKINKLDKEEEKPEKKKLQDFLKTMKDELNKPIEMFNKQNPLVKDNSNLPLYIGIFIGALALILAGVGIFMYMKKNKTTDEEEQEQELA